MENDNNIEKKGNIQNIIIIILIIIIIILLALSIYFAYMYFNSSKKDSLTGNVDIFDINCEDDNNCTIGNNDSNKDNTNTSTNTTSQNSSNSIDKNSNSNNNDNSSNTPNTDEELDDDFVISDQKVVWQSTNKVDIFNKNIYNTKNGTIAPGEHNSYEFIVRNNTKTVINYIIKFAEDNKEKIDMVYKLKRNGKYIVDNWTSVDKINLNKTTIESGNKDTYILEWYWKDNDSIDNKYGSDGGNYQLSIDITGEKVN